VTKDPRRLTVPTSSLAYASWLGNVRRLSFLGAACVALLLTACAPEEDQVARPKAVPEPELLEERLILSPARYTDLPDWEGDSLEESLPALRLSCGRLEKQPDVRPVGPDGLAGTVADWRAPCAALAGVPANDRPALRGLLETWFEPFKAEGLEGEEGLFTGYYEAELKGTAVPNGANSTPIYRIPEDLVQVDLGLFRADLEGERIVGRVETGRLLPYLTRTEIESGALAGKGLELIWADDPVDAFFLQVQGSGRVVLPNGEVRRVGFAGSNGHEFYAIGRAMIDEGIVSRERASMQEMRDWLRANPIEAREIMQRNDRYIFFREIEGAGPIGSQGVPLTPGRSLAVDPAFLPLGIPVYLDTTWPASDRPLRRLMVAQDTGSAIKGPVRGDFFWGFGEEALAEAGRMKQSGVYYLLLPKTVAERRKKTS